MLDDSYNRWGEVSGLTFQYFAINSQSTGAFAVPNSVSNSATTPEILVSGHSIDGQVGGNTLACNFFPNTGDMVIDTDNTTFFSNMGNNARAARNVAGHEVGHGIGFDHVESSDSQFLLEPSASSNPVFDGPQFDEILGAQRLYGDVFEKSGGNDTSGTATSLGTIAASTTVSRGTAASNSSTVVALAATDFVSVDDEGDTDFYSFTLSQTSDVSLLLAPKGPTYNQGPQGGVSPQPSFNALQQSDLTLTLFDTNGSTQLATANANGLGGSETITQNSLAAGTYFVRVTGATTNEVQMYQLDVQNTSTGINTVSANDSSGTTGNAAANGVADTFLVRRNGAGTMIEVLANGVVAGTFDLTTPVQINGSTDNDTVTFDYTNGDAMPTGGVSFVGSTGTNTLNVTGAGNVTTINYAPDSTTNGNGTLTIDAKTATFSGLTPLNVTEVTNFTLTTPNGDDALTIDSPSGTENRVSGTSGGVGFEAVTFSTVTNFIIDADANDDRSPADTITFISDLLATSLSTFTVESAAGSTTTFSGGISSASSIDVTSGTINVNNSVTVTGAATISLDAIGNAGVVNVNQAISTATGAITITADDDVLFAPTGDLTTSMGSITVRGDDDATADAGAGGAVTMADGTVINAGSGTITLSADETISVGRLISTNGAAVTLALSDITSTLNSCDGMSVAAASSISLNASRFTGNGDDGIDLDNVTGATNIVETTATGNVADGFDTNATGDVTLNGGTFNGIMTRAANNFTFNSTTTGSISVPGVIDIESNNAIDINADIDASTNTIRLLANQDAAGAEGITIANDASLVTLNESANAVFIAVNTLVGGTGSAAISTISAGTTSGQITIIAMNSSVTDANIGTNLTANSALLASSGSIGSVSDRIETSLSNVEGSGMTGFFLTNTGTLVIGGVDGGTTGVTSMGGIADVQTNSLLTVAENVSANSVFLKANDSAGFGDDLTVLAGVSVQATAGNVDLQAGDDVTVQAASAIIATVAINIEIDCDNADLGTGSTATIAGQLTAPSGINISGQGDSDNFNITYPTGATFGGAISITDSGNSVDMVTINGTAADEMLFVTPGATNVVGRAGAATETISFAANIETLRLNAGDGDDTVTTSPSTSLSQTLDGGAPGIGAVPGDTLNFNAGGTFSISGNVISTPNNQDVAFQNFENLPLTNPSPTGDLLFDFGQSNSAVQAGYIQVLHTTLFSDGLGFGWDRQGAAHFLNNSYFGNVRRDIIIDNTTFGPAPATFSANVADGDVLVNVTFGSQFNALDDFRIFNADTGEELAADLSTRAFHSSHVSFVTTVTNSQLNLTFVPPNQIPRLASINAIEIRSSSALLAMGLTGVSSPIDGDGATIDDYSSRYPGHCVDNFGYDHQQRCRTRFGWDSNPHRRRGSSDLAVDATDRLWNGAC